MTEEEAQNRLGKNLLLLLIVAILFPVMGIFWFARNLHPAFKWAFNSIFFALFFNQTARFVLESYTPLMQTLLENLHRGLNWSSPIYFYLSVNDIIFTAIYGLVPLLVTIYFYRRLGAFKKVWFRTRWGEIMSNLSWRRHSSSFFIAIFCYRRLLSALFVVLLAEFPWAQVALTVYVNQTVIISVGLSSPFRYRSEEFLELLNEANIMLCAYHLFLFTDFLDDAYVRTQVGMSMNFFTLLNIVINLGLVVFCTIREAHRKGKMIWKKYLKEKRQ